VVARSPQRTSKEEDGTELVRTGHERSRSRLRAAVCPSYNAHQGIRSLFSRDRHGGSGRRKCRRRAAL